jgi:hypothetical protein
VTPEPELYEVTFPNRQVLLFRYHVIQLNRLNRRDFVRQPNPVAAALMTRMNITPEDRPKVKMECLRIIATLKLNPARNALIGEFMLRYLRLSQSETAVYNQQVVSLEPPERSQVVELMHEWVEEAVHAKGKMVATRQLQHRFGPISPELRGRVEQLSLEALDELVTAILDFKNLTEAEAWISQHQQSAE